MAFTGSSPWGPGAQTFGKQAQVQNGAGWTDWKYTGGTPTTDQINSGLAQWDAPPPQVPKGYTGQTWMGKPVTVGADGKAHLQLAGGLLPDATIDTRPAQRAVARAQGQYAPDPDQNIETPGPAEQAWNQVGQQFFQPGPQQQFWAQHGNDFTQPDANAQAWERFQAQGPLRNNAQAEYDAFGGRRPNIAAEPGFGSYYDNAQKNVVNALNTQLGARGAYGSSVGLGQIGKSVTDLRADQAKNEADYNLKRLAEQRNWDELGGTLARNADLSGQTNLSTMGTLANNASTSRNTAYRNASDAATAAGTERARGLEGGMAAAGLAQGAREGRIGMGWDAVSKMQGVMQNILGSNYEAWLNGDYQLTQDDLNAGLAQATENNNFRSQQGGLGGWIKDILGGTILGNIGGGK